MRNLFSLSVFLFLLVFRLSAQMDANYDEAKIPNYILPETLRLENGTYITSVSDWEKLRRPEIIEMFSTQMFGKTPTQNLKVTYKTVAENENDLNGLAHSRQILMTFSNGSDFRDVMLLIFYPNNIKGKAPVMLSYNWGGNQTVAPNSDIIPSISAQRRIAKDSTRVRRGNDSSFWSINMIVSLGYAFVTLSPTDIYPDTKGIEAKEESIMPLFDDYKTTKDNPDSWGAIGAWAWGLSRVMDYMEKDTRLDAKKVAIMGHSRHGKAVLWAGAQDKRFSVVISNNSGCGGAALFKRVIGENIEIITTAFPYWFCKNFNQYAANEDKLPFDQHQLLALVAPRALYVASAEDDLWADPKGEFLSAVYAGQIYKLYGKKGLETDIMPQIHQPIMVGDVGYHIRAGKHSVTNYDWLAFINFANKSLFKF